MYTIRQMLNSTPRNIIQNSYRVSIREFQPTMDSDQNGPYSYVNFHARDKDGIRKVELKIYDRDRAWVYCTCPWFKYSCEVSLSVRGSSTIRNSDGSMPTDRNPMLKPWVCKHVIAVILHLSRTGSFNL